MAGPAEVYQHVVIDGKRPAIPPRCPPQLATLIKQCLEYDPEKRPTFQQILDSHALDDDGPPSAHCTGATRRILNTHRTHTHTMDSDR